MATWIFQGNPEKFDIDGYLRAGLSTITWVVRQHRSRVAPGDKVFLWRSGAAAGVVAECRVVSNVEDLPPDPATMPFARTFDLKVEPRVELILIRLATSKEVIKRDGLKKDPIFRSHRLFSFAAETNYSLEPGHERRLVSLWARVGVDWTWRESVAGLWAYASTLGREVSELAESPVANVSVEINRTASGVYNKVMNFRALDPTDDRAGLTGASETDRLVWSTFFDASASKIDIEKLAGEVSRLGLRLDGTGPAAAPAVPDVPKANGTLDELLRRYAVAASRNVFSSRPPEVLTERRTFERNPLIPEIARLFAGSRCEVPGCLTRTFTTERGDNFCEVHHVVPLAEGGVDLLENVICLCPVHHREAHHGRARISLREIMTKVRQARPIALPPL